MKDKKCRVTMEPELEEMAENWGPAMRMIIAKKFRRWARELEVSAFIMACDEEPIRHKILRLLPLRKAKLN